MSRREIRIVIEDQTWDDEQQEWLLDRLSCVLNAEIGDYYAIEEIDI